jgi:hypothetical protein
MVAVIRGISPLGRSGRGFGGRCLLASVPRVSPLELISVLLVA